MYISRFRGANFISSGSPETSIFKWLIIHRRRTATDGGGGRLSCSRSGRLGLWFLTIWLFSVARRHAALFVATVEVDDFGGRRDLLPLLRRHIFRRLRNWPKQSIKYFPLNHIFDIYIYIWGKGTFKLYLILGKN